MSADNIVNGKEGAQRDVLSLFGEVRNKASAFLEQVDSRRRLQIRELQSVLDRINSMAIRISELENPAVSCLFPVSSMSRIDQSRTSATVRLDAESATLLEKDYILVETGLDSVRFFSSAGSVEYIPPAWRVISVSEIPVGTFEVLFRNPVESGVVIFDTVLSSQEVEIEVSGSLQGVRYSPVEKVIRSGYRVTCWIGNSQVRHLRIRIRPLQPDSPGGSSYTFGITDLKILQSRYFLRSEFWSEWVRWKPSSPFVRFSASAHQGLSYYLWLGNRPESGSKESLSLFSVQPGQVIAVPGARVYRDIPASVDSGGNVVMTIDGSQTNLFPANTDPNSVLLVELDGQAEREEKVWTGLGYSPSIQAEGYALELTRNSTTLSYHANRLRALAVPYTQNPLRVSFWTIPDELDAVLLVQIISHSEYTTPVFSGAALERWQ